MSTVMVIGTPLQPNLPPPPFEVKETEPRDTTEFDFIGQVTDAKGQVKGNVRDTIKVKMGEGAAQFAGKNIQYDTGFTLSPGKYRLKFLARENQGAKMGTFETDFTIPNLNADRTGLRVSSVVWSGQRQPIAEAIGAGANQKLLVNHPWCMKVRS